VIQLLIGPESVWTSLYLGGMTTSSSATRPALWPVNGLSALIDLAVSSHRRAAVLLLLVSLLAFLPGFFQIPPVDRDEAYFAQATKQMVETGDYIDIRYQNNVRYRKPIGIYWLQAAAVKTAEALGIRDARSTIWLYRIPSLVAAIGAVLATYWCALAFIARRGALLAALMMAGSILLNIEARLAKTDAVLLFAVVVAMGALARAYMTPPKDAGEASGTWHLPAVFWTALAAGILDKGPLILMVVGLAALTLSISERSARWLQALRPVSGIIWLFLLVSPWFVAIWMRVGSAFLVDSVGHDMMSKVGGGQETHGAPPGYYVILFFVTFFPASVLAPSAVPAVWIARREPAARFLLAWLIPAWIVFELVPTKLPHYVLPLYPAIAILIASVVEGKVLSPRPFLRRATVWWFIVPVLFGFIGIASAVVISHNLRLAAWPFLAAATVCGLFAWRLYADDGAEQSLMRAVAAAILIFAGIFGVVLPSLAPAFPSVALAKMLGDAACPFPVAASVGYEEPSLVFLSGTATRFTDPAGAADFLLGGGCRFAFIEKRQERSFALRAEAVGLRYKAGPRIEGYNISNGQRIAVGVFRPADAP
jgi:4-amino-4-deoxy-L-arabinose transferase-like glycosyltransferase